MKDKVKNPRQFNFKHAASTAQILLLGFLVGGLVMLIGGYNPIQVYAKMITGVFGSPKYIAYTIIKATPIIGTGLAIAFANKSGLFNIGAEGQFMVGTIVAAMAGYLLKLPPFIHPLTVMLICALAGGAWGALSGYLKARHGINEVISGIMLNWTALYLRNAIVVQPWFEKSSNVSFAIQPTAEINILSGWAKSPEGKAFLADNKMLSEIFKTELNYGILFVIGLAILTWFIMEKTTTGYSIKAVGLNRYAAEYAGISVEKNYILALFIAGALAGIAGGIQVSGVSHNLSVLAASEGYGFDGIAVALIGNNSSLGCVLAGLLFSALKYGGSKIQQAPINAPSEIINIMIGVIMLFTAMPTLVSEIRRRLTKRRKIDV